MTALLAVIAVSVVVRCGDDRDDDEEDEERRLTLITDVRPEAAAMSADRTSQTHRPRRSFDEIPFGARAG